jgi:hypothetical protein
MHGWDICIHLCVGRGGLAVRRPSRDPLHAMACGRRVPREFQVQVPGAAAARGAHAQAHKQRTGGVHGLDASERRGVGSHTPRGWSRSSTTTIAIATDAVVLVRPVPAARPSEPGGVVAGLTSAVPISIGVLRQRRGPDALLHAHAQSSASRSVCSPTRAGRTGGRIPYPLLGGVHAL